MAPMPEIYSVSFSLFNLVLGKFAVVAILVLVLGQFIYNVYFHPLAGFPGPILYRGSNIPKIIQQMKGTINDRMLEFHQQYGPVVRLAPNELTYTTATALKEIYGNRGGKKPMPPQSSLGTNEKKMFGATSLLWLESHVEHSRHRKVLAPSFSDASLRAQEPIILGYVNLLMKRFREHAARGEALDVWSWFNFFTFDLIGDLTFGESFGCVQTGHFHPWISFIFSNLTSMMYAQMITTMGYLGTVIELIAPKRLFAEALAHASFTRDKVDRRLVRKTDRPDFFTGILKHVNKPGGITSNELYADSQIFLMAGSETSATALAVAVYHLVRFPDKLAKLRDEIRNAFASEDEIVFANVSSLPYLLAVINESLRIHPPLPAGINRLVPSGGAVIDGKFVAGGTILQVPHWATFHLEENFEDPWSFVPERWLETCPDRYKSDNREVFQPFSHGARNCIGRSLAYMEMRCVLARLVWGFDMELQPDSLDWNKQRVFLLYEKRPLNLKLTEVCRGEKVQSES